MSDAARFISLVLVILLAVLLLILLTACTRSLIPSSDADDASDDMLNDDTKAADSGTETNEASSPGELIPLDAREDDRPALACEVQSAEEG